MKLYTVYTNDLAEYQGQPLGPDWVVVAIVGSTDPFYPTGWLPECETCNKRFGKTICCKVRRAQIDAELDRSGSEQP